MDHSNVLALIMEIEPRAITNPSTRSHSGMVSLTLAVGIRPSESN
jgi:hypothetical protein